MSATTEKLVIPAIENKTFDLQFPDDIDMDYDAELEYKQTHSYCCGADMKNSLTMDGPSYLDLCLCPECNDHTGTIYEAETL